VLARARVIGDYHARFCEGLEVKFLRPTRPLVPTTTAELLLHLIMSSLNPHAVVAGDAVGRSLPCMTERKVGLAY